MRHGAEGKIADARRGQRLCGYYDGDKNWTFLSYQGKNSGIYAWGRPDAGWFAGKGDQLLAVLDTVEWEPAA